jgi:hypothetical protein
MHGGTSILRIIEIIAALFFTLLGLGTAAISVFYRKDIIRTERQIARIKLGLEKDSIINSPIAVPPPTKQTDAEFQKV